MHLCFVIILSVIIHVKTWNNVNIFFLKKWWENHIQMLLGIKNHEPLLGIVFWRISMTVQRIYGNTPNAIWIKQMRSDRLYHSSSWEAQESTKVDHLHFWWLRSIYPKDMLPLPPFLSWVLLPSKWLLTLLFLGTTMKVQRNQCFVVMVWFFYRFLKAALLWIGPKIIYMYNRSQRQQIRLTPINSS